MPRPPRLHATGVLYYVSQQGVQDRPLFRNEQDTAHYLELLREYKAKHGFKLFAYSIASSGISLLVEPCSETTISEIMRDITSRYSKYYNAVYGGDGPLFKGRFRTCIADKEQLSRLVRFVHSQPVWAAPGSVFGDSRNLFLEEQPAGHPLKDALNTEIAEIEAHLREMAKPMASLVEVMEAQEMEEAAQEVSKPFLGPESFVKRIAQAGKEIHESKAAVGAPTAVPPAPLPAGIPFAAVLKAGALLAFAGAFALVWNSGFLRMPHKAPAASSNVLAAAAEAKSEPAAVSQKAQRLALEGSTWDVQIIPMAKEERANIEQDALIFSGNKVESHFLAQKGFTPTHYNLTINTDGGITWETVQRSAAGEVVSLRGEWRGREMTGVLSYSMDEQAHGQQPKNFNFVGVLRGGNS
ncbi:MAG TPA: transposase [Verrucomicrobiae bacterium]|jgi:hypothetical protein|nr:transposase [Verrucomicrobiae bacterium]